MAGGSWSVTEMPVLPGLYLNFEAAALASIQAGARGVVVTPVKAHWGPVRQFVQIKSEADISEIYTNDESSGATARATLRFALMGGAKKLLAYRLANDSAAAAVINLADTETVPLDMMRLESKYPTDRNFIVTIQDNAIDANNKDLKLYEGSKLLRTFTFGSGSVDAAVYAINNDGGNKWIVAVKLGNGNGIFQNIENQVFTGGNAGIGEINAEAYTDALAAFECQEFNILTLDGVTTPEIQTSVASWVQRVRREGKMVMAVMGGPASDDKATDAVAKAIARTAGFNFEGLINVGAGVVLDDVTYSSAQVAPYVAGLIAGQKLSESTTYAATPFDDVTRRWTRSEQEQAVTNGVYLLIHDGRIVKVLRGMNSLITLRQAQNNSWKKVRAIRVMDAITCDLMKAAEDNYVGKVNNTEEGRLALIGACKQYMETLAQGGVIEHTGWDVYLDPVYYGENASITPEPDQVFLKWEARLTDVMEIIMGTFIVK